MAVARYSALLLVLGLLVVGSLASLDARIIANLASFQSPSGGFVGSNDEVTLQATNQALFLASLYGTRNQLNLAPIPGFIRTCENADGGFGQSASAASDVASTRNALLSLTYLDQEINAAQVSKFLASRFESSGLASNANGQPASLEATAQALQSFDLLNDRKNAAIPTSVLVSLLNGASKGDHFEFAGVSLAAGNYYGIVIASIVDYDFDDIAAWAAFIGRQQAGNGGFYENGAGSATTLEATAQSVSAMKILSKIAQQRFTNSLAFPSLKTFITRTADTLNDAALAHLVVALTNFDDVVKVSVSYEPSNPSLPVKDSRAIVGSQIKPSIAVKAFNTIVHSGLDVEVTYTLPGDSPKSQRLVASTSGAYTADDFVESQQFGQVTFKFSANQYVETVGRMEFEISDTVSFGYGIEVVSNAVHGATGKEVAERESVPLGTDFTFQVALFTSTETQKTSGDFDVIFSLRDASGIVLYQKVEDARSRSDDAFTFTYTLDTPALPTGYLSFQFDVRGSDNVVHTSDTVLFVYSSTMLATEIDFEDSDGEFTLGSTATVYMTPAVLPDLKNVNALPSTDFFGTDVYEQRQFLLDLTTLSGTSVGSYRGVHAQGGRYKFSVPLSHSLDSLGTSVLAFRFLTSSSHTVALSAYDSVAEEVLDDPHAVNITVTAQLQASGIADQAVPSSLSYGNQVSLTFQLQDVNTGRAVSKGERGNVFLLLNHVDAEHEAAFTSSKQAAVERDGEFTVTWNVDPNAIRGAGYLTVVAENADGAQVPISGTDGKPLRYDVTIDGNIDIAFTATSTDNPFLSAAAFLAQVKLSSNGRPLQGAKLSVEVVPSSGETFSALVANGADGVYTVSWIASHTKAYSGTYTLRFFREADRVQAAEIDAANEKKYRKERRERELRGQEVGEEEVLPKTPVTPLFEKSLSHSQVVHRPWPIRIDFVVFFGFAYALWSIWTKSSSTTQ